MNSNSAIALYSSLQHHMPLLMLLDRYERVIWESDALSGLFMLKSNAGQSLKALAGITVKDLLKDPQRVRLGSMKAYQAYGYDLTGELAGQMASHDGKKMEEVATLVVLEALQDFSNDKVKRHCLETIIDAISDGIVVSDSDGRVVVYNRAQEALEDLQADEMVGKFLWEAYQYNSDSESEHRDVFRSGEAVVSKYKAHAYNKGVPKYVTYSTFPLTLEGEKVGVFSISKNETKLQALLSETMDLKRHARTDWQPAKEDVRPNGTRFTFSDIIGSSEDMTHLIHEAQTVALLENNVLIIGETGSGKEVFAQSMHNFGKKNDQPFVGINCAAIPENLLESILFGAVKGAYTGALDQRGLFEEAGSGTLFLDELNSMPIAMQSKLLRVIQERKVRRVGGTTLQPVRCRIICATNEDPHKLIREGRLRQDLFYRIAGLCLYIPPLRDRLQDIEVLSHHFIDHYNRLLDRQIQSLSPTLAALLYAYDWPGNTRELEHVVENLMVRSKKEQVELTLDHLPPYLKTVLCSQTLLAVGKEEPFKPCTESFEADSSGTERLPELLRTVEARAIRAAMARHRGNVSAAAKDLGIIRQSLLYRLKKLDIQR